MNCDSLAACFFGGLFAANGVPHFIVGMLGPAFQTPLTKPPGKGYSSSTVNSLWGTLNFAIAWVLLVPLGDFDTPDLHDVAHSCRAASSSASRWPAP